MSWGEKELEEQIENYFKNVTKEQFLKDLEKANCLHLVEDIGDEDLENDRDMLIAIKEAKLMEDGESPKKTAREFLKERKTKK
jgi:hypothetical protein